MKLVGAAAACIGGLVIRYAGDTPEAKYAGIGCFIWMKAWSKNHLNDISKL